MRLPDFELDGWCLDDGEEYHRRAPDTFWIPDLAHRQALYPGNLVKLIFRIAVDDPQADTAFERMWVVVRERIQGGYWGVLDNDPECLEENDELWHGIELPFEPRHVIDIDIPDEATMAIARQVPKRRWS